METAKDKNGFTEAQRNELKLARSAILNAQAGVVLKHAMYPRLTEVVAEIERMLGIIQ